MLISESNCKKSPLNSSNPLRRDSELAIGQIKICPLLFSLVLTSSKILETLAKSLFLKCVALLLDSVKYVVSVVETVEFMFVESNAKDSKDSDETLDSTLLSCRV